MINLSKRVNKLLEKTSSLECKNVCKEILEMYQNVPEEQLTQALVEKLKDIKDSDKHVASFVQSTEKTLRIKDLGIASAISKIRESQSYHYPALRYALDRFERAKINEGVLDYLMVEDFVSSLKDFVWDSNVKEALELVRGKFEADKELVQVSKAIFEFRKSKGNFIFEKACEMLEEHYENPTDASRSAIIETLAKFSYSPVAKSLIESLKRIQASASKGLQIIAENANCNLSQVFSTLFVENEKEYFTIKGDVYKKSGSVVEKVTVDEFQNLSENIKRSYQIMNSTNFFVKEGKASFYLGRNKIEISEADNTTRVLFNGKQVPSEDIARNLVSTGMIRLEEAKVASDIQFVNDTFKNFFELDFAKVISSKMYEGSYVTLMKVDENIYLNKVNTSMRSNEFFSELNATQARNIILEFLGYDIKESLLEFIEKDEREINSIKEQQNEIIKNMTVLEAEINKIESAKKDDFIAAQPAIKSLQEMLQKELQELKDSYTTLSSKLKKFEGKSSDAGIEIGEDVKIAGTGALATVTAIDSNTKMVSVVTSDGKTDEFPISKIISVEKAEESAMKRNEEKAEKEEKKEPTAKVEEASISTGNEISVEDPNKDRLPSQEPVSPELTVDDNKKDEFVHGTVDASQEGACAGKDVEVLASDFAAKGPEDLIEVKCEDETYFIEKKFLKVSTTEGDDSMTIDFDAEAPSDEEKKDDSEEKPESEEKKDDSEEKSDDEDKKDDKEGSSDDSDKEDKPENKLEILQSKLAKALKDLEEIKADMNDSFTSNETISMSITSLKGLTDALKKDLSETKS